MLFKVIQGHRSGYQWKARMQLPVITDILSRSAQSYRRLWLKFWIKPVTLHFWAPLGGLRATYKVHLRLIGSS